MASPVSSSHARQQFAFSGWLWLYAEMTPGCEGGTEGTWIMGPTDVPQPDATLRIRPDKGGQSGKIGSYLSGAPELIVEISGSSTSRDLGIKLELYQRAGVKEYITVLLQPERILWRRLSGTQYEELLPGPDGVLRSATFPGLWLDPIAAFDPAKSLRTALESGLRSAEHASFVQSLSK